MAKHFSPPFVSFCLSFMVSMGFISIMSNDANSEGLVLNQATVLPQILVTADKEIDGDVDGYKAGSTRSSTRTDTPLINVPQSVSVVTQEQIRDQNISSMEEALRYVPGVNIQQGESNRDQITIRGNNTTADFFVDGARDDLQYFRDFYNIDRVEFLKGPNAMAFGRGGSGGVVNRVSKFADGERRYKLALSGGSFDNRRVEADLGNKVNNKFSLRLNSVYEKSGSFRQYGDLERYGFNPTGTFILGKNTDIKFGYEHFSDSRFNDRGIPSEQGAPYKTSPSKFFGNPNENGADAKIDSGYLTINHDFTPTTQIRNYTRYTKNSKFYQNVYASSVVNTSGNLSIGAYNNETERNNFTNQTDLTKKFTTGTLNHTALVGLEITRQNSDNLRNTGYFNNSATTESISVNNPLSFTPITFRQSITDTDNRSEVSVYGGYLQDQIEINKYLQLTGGVRLDRFAVNLKDNRNGQNFRRIDSMLSPRFGIVLKPKDSLSIYSSYATTYLPSSGDQFSSLSAKTKILEPEKMQNYELGAKWDLNPSLNLSAAIYQLNRTNTRANDPNGYFVLTGESRTRGLELGAMGRITEKWQVIAGYAWQDAVIVSQTDVATAGKRVGLVPRYKASLWNKYDFTPKWAAGLGLVSQSDQFATVDNSVRLKGFSRFDAAIYHQINPSYRFQVNVENLFNRKYIQTAHNNNNIQPGSPQMFKASLIANF